MSTPADGEADPALAAIRAIWADRRDEVIARVDVIEEAITNALMGDLGDDLRSRAAHEAHRLAGSAGTFGFETASAYAREIELGLKAVVMPATDELQRLAELVVGLRHDLESDQESGPLAKASPTPLVPNGHVDILGVAIDPRRGRRLATETAARGLVAVFAVDAEDAHQALSSTPRAGGDGGEVAGHARACRGESTHHRPRRTRSGGQSRGRAPGRTRIARLPEHDRRDR